MRGDRLFTPGNRERCNSFFLLKEIEVSEILQHQQELYVPRVVSPQRLPPTWLGSGTAPHACSTHAVLPRPEPGFNLQPAPMLTTGCFLLELLYPKLKSSLPQCL